MFKGQAVNFLWGHISNNKKFWARSVQQFWRLLDTNRKTNSQAKYVYTKEKMLDSLITNWATKIKLLKINSAIFWQKKIFLYPFQIYLTSLFLNISFEEFTDLAFSRDSRQKLIL